MKALILAACLSLGACATLTPSTITMDAKKGLTAARALHYTACSTVEQLHAAGTLKGQSFNDAKKLCIVSDDYMDAGDVALLIGDQATASERAKQALAAIYKVQAITGE